MAEIFSDLERLMLVAVQVSTLVRPLQPEQWRHLREQVLCAQPTEVLLVPVINQALEIVLKAVRAAPQAEEPKELLACVKLIPAADLRLLLKEHLLEDLQIMLMLRAPMLVKEMPPCKEVTSCIHQAELQLQAKDVQPHLREQMYLTEAWPLQEVLRQREVLLRREVPHLPEAQYKEHLPEVIIVLQREAQRLREVCHLQEVRLPHLQEALLLHQAEAQLLPEALALHLVEVYLLLEVLVLHQVEVQPLLEEEDAKIQFLQVPPKWGTFFRMYREK